MPKQPRPPRLSQSQFQSAITSKPLDSPPKRVIPKRVIPPDVTADEPIAIADETTTVLDEMTAVATTTQALPIVPISGGNGGAVETLRSWLSTDGIPGPELIAHWRRMLDAERSTGGRNPVDVPDNVARCEAGKVMLELYRSAGLLPPLRTAQASAQPKVSVSFQLPGGTMKVEVGGDPND